MYTKSDLFRHKQGYTTGRSSYVPKLNLLTPVGNCTITGAWGEIEEVVELEFGSSRKSGVAGVVPGPIGQKDGRSNTLN